MRREDGIEIEATVTGALSATLFKVEIENGHRFLAFLGRGSRAGLPGLCPGDRVTVRLSPFDLSKGRIIGPGEERS
jgi:translation initiation factor IF-1